jgi:hypothetical protein
MIGRIARRLARDDYPGGSLAALRRLRPEAPDGATFWRLVADTAEPLFDDARGQCVLAAVVRGMALAHPFHLPLGGRRPLGTAMAEARLLRLLRLGRDDLPEELVAWPGSWPPKATTALRLGRCRLPATHRRRPRCRAPADRPRLYYRAEFRLSRPEESAA